MPQESKYPNRLYFGDCLDVMRRDIDDESIDLIYLDPPFNSKRIYNTFIGDAQWVAFDGTWQWHEAIDDFDDVASDPQLAPTMEGLRKILGESGNLAYLSYMANRLRECCRVLKPTGSIYLHCDPMMSHYLKIVMDGIFGHQRFLNEISWKRATAKSDYRQGARLYSRMRDVLLYFGDRNASVFCQPLMPYSLEYIQRTYRHIEEGTGRRYSLDNLATPGRGTRGHPRYEFLGVTRYWRYNEEKMQQLLDENRIIQTARGRVPRFKRYLDEGSGVAIGDNWDDIPPVQGNSKEYMDYQTQKPVKLLERIINASSSRGDTVLDPFCGCGTSIEAAQRNGRKWIGIDVCVRACQIIEERMRGSLGLTRSDVQFIGIPKTANDAKTLASLDKFRFEKWAASLIDGMEANKKQREDGGIDGHGRLAIKKGKFVDMVSQVKGGGTGPGDVQAFNGARQQVSADL